MLGSYKYYVKVYVVGNKKKIKGREFFVGGTFIICPLLPLS